MAGKLPMGQKELLRGKMMEMVMQEQMTLKEAGIRLKISYRQAKRILKRYREGGDAALIHRGMGRPSNRREDAALKARVLAVYKERYGDFGPTFAAEKLLENEGLKAAAETLRVWLMEAGLWERRRRSNVYRSRRERRECFGERGNFVAECSLMGRTTHGLRGVGLSAV